jgi:N-acetylglucosamine-6-phosphate deacetylase
MVEKMLRLPSLEVMQKLLDIAQGTLKLVTVAPELPGAKELIRLLCRNQVTVSAGHTDCPPELFPEAVSWGVSRVCHLFDAWDLPEARGGVRQPAVTDLALIDDRVMKEIIVDGLHVPPELVRLARRAAGAEHIIAISDAMQGAGLKSGRFHDCGEWYIIRDGDVARRERDNAIVGSSLSMNHAFHNMVTRFGFTVPEASLALSGNPARSIGMGGTTGTIAPGFEADLTILAPDMLTVRNCFVGGKELYQS